MFPLGLALIALFGCSPTAPETVLDSVFVYDTTYVDVLYNPGFVITGLTSGEYTDYPYFKVWYNVVVIKTDTTKYDSAWAICYLFNSNKTEIMSESWGLLPFGMEKGGKPRGIVIYADSVLDGTKGLYHPRYGIWAK